MVKGSILTASLPDDFAKDIDRVTFVKFFPAQPRRELGKYELKGAVAYLDSEGAGSGAERRLRLDMTAPTIEKIRELYQAIRAGTIRPRESWGAQQDPRGKQPTIWLPPGVQYN